MDSKQIVQNLLQGSRNIDRMKKEVEQVVKMIIGCAFMSNHRGCLEVDLHETFETSSCIWKVRGTMGAMNRTKNKIEVECVLKLPCSAPHQDHFILSLSYCSEGRIPFHSEYAQQVYENLFVFVEGMMRIMPDIEKEWAMFINASTVFQDN